ncbi:toxin [Streptomyces inusitatus]|uniref:Toxin n=1 Tax=Streptomyces inusitatus TaxID=68221 RepID=A0A918PXC1_9ACTN|nr:DUF397 domain-containing protein [Streptomyces inusitatus]GGZ25024.1 toxin [Streptomyces inusitatus]
MNGEHLHWVKSSYSSGSGGNCLEVALTWEKSSYSGGSGGACVEVATCPTLIHVRDSKQPTEGHLTLPAPTWSAFLTYARTHTV